MYTIQTIRVENSSGDGVPEELKCPICLKVPDAEIYQCVTGHTVCSLCLANIQSQGNNECPQCKLKFEGQLIRVRVLEALVEAVAFPCPYKISGCKENIAKKDVDHHVKMMCLFNGKCLQLCKCLGYKCNVWTKETNAKNGVGHFEKDHNAVALLAHADCDEEIWNCGGTIHIKNLFSAMETGRTNGVSRPVVISMNRDHFMILTLLNVIDKSVSWICLKLSEDKNPKRKVLEVEFTIESQSKSRPELQWKVPTVPMMRSEEFIKCPVNRMPIQLLMQRYRSKHDNADLTVKFIITTIPVVNGRPEYSQISGVTKKLGSAVIDHFTPRRGCERGENGL